MIATLRKTLPAAVTLAGLASGISASLLVLQHRFVAACICILIGTVLDATDGSLARRLNATSPFGLQLDSLADMVTFGVAPSILAYAYLSSLGISAIVLWPVCIAFTASGALRLARFNLLPPKTSLNDTVGLTISMAGATVTLSVLVHLTHGQQFAPGAIFPLLLVLLSALMISRIGYPELGTVFRARWLASSWLVALIMLSIWRSPQVAGLALVFPYVGFGLIRSAYLWAR